MTCFSKNRTPPFGGVGGFTLLEMAIVLAIIGVVLAGGAVTFSASVQQRQFDGTKEKMVVLQKALRDYWRTFGRLPCPANLSLYNTVDSAAANQYFGKEAATPGTCTGGTPTANFTSVSIVAGMVPTKTLQLPDDYALDGWGRRIFYAVDTDYTETDAAANLAGADADIVSGTTRITVNHSAAATKTTQGVYVLLSHGPNGHGAYPRYASATVNSSRVSSGSGNAMELENCDCLANGTSGTFNTTFYQAPYSTDTASITDTFDDLLTYATRGNLHSANE